MVVDIIIRVHSAEHVLWVQATSANYGDVALQLDQRKSGHLLKRYNIEKSAALDAQVHRSLLFMNTNSIIY